MTPSREHTDREYEGELADVRARLMRMGTLCEDMIEQAMRALSERDTALARATYDKDDEVNRLEVSIDDLVLRILARRQPVASDLRFLASSLKLVTDLERIGDLVANICDRVVELDEEPPMRPYGSLQLMASATTGMVHDALAAFVARDAKRAKDLLERDRVVDDYYRQLFGELLAEMMADGKNVYRATRLQSIAKYLERIADHATNIAERVVFLVEGKDIRHPFSRVTGA
ncbi:MAG TPA: phosphate signaling complex protein PhoU [Kofleriaceae bacterium]|jgi:phosphate transport system protein|nr:phosphate signaling complex protein PhoU [Kofleriaceae bacterium]